MGVCVRMCVFMSLYILYVCICTCTIIYISTTWERPSGPIFDGPWRRSLTTALADGHRRSIGGAYLKSLMTSARTCNIVGSDKIPLANNSVTSYTGKRENPVS